MHLDDGVERAPEAVAAEEPDGLRRRGALRAGVAAAALGAAGWALAGCGPARAARATAAATTGPRPGGAFDVRGYGALGDGHHDDTAAIQKAIAAAHEAGGGTVLLPTGTYAVRTIQLLQNVDLVGENRLSSVLLATGAEGNAVVLHSVSFSRLANFQIKIGVAQPAASGAAVYLDRSFTVFLDDLYVDGAGKGYDGIVVHESTATFIRGFNIYSLRNDAVRVEGPRGNDCYLAGGIINLGQVAGGAGVHLRNFPAGAFNLTDADILQGAYGLLVDGANYLRFENTYFDSSANGALLRSGNLITFSNCWFSNRPGPGLTIGGARGVSVLGGQAANCGGHGILITDQALGVSLVGVQVVGNNTAQRGSDGIRVEGGASYVSVANCIVGNDPGIFQTPGQEVGIHVRADAGGDCAVIGNLLFGNVRAPVVDRLSATGYGAGNLSEPPGSTFVPPSGAVNLAAGVAPAIAMNSPDGKAVTLAPVGSGAAAHYRARFGRAVAKVSHVPAQGDWVTFPLSTLKRGSTYTFMATVWGSGVAYLDVWNGEQDVTSLPVTLISSPQTVSLNVTLPASGLSGNATPQLQVRTHHFPTDVRFRVGVYAAAAHAAKA